MKPDFMDRTAKIIAEVMVRTCIGKLDTKVIEDILKVELNEYYNELFTYARNIGYGEGYTAGHRTRLGEAVKRAYYEGYDDGLNESAYEAGYKHVK